MKNSERNRLVLENFLLHVTHVNGDDNERDIDVQMSWTPRELYQHLDDYIEEDHVDGKLNPEDQTEYEIGDEVWCDGDKDEVIDIVSPKDKENYEAGYRYILKIHGTQSPTNFI